MTIDCFNQLTEALETGPVVLATIVNTQGSVPREIGAKMLICADGQIRGTIGGGAGEAKVIRQAAIVMTTGEKQRVEIDLSGSLLQPRQTQGICGGTMQVWLERWQGESAIALAHQICQILRSGQSITLVTPWEVNRSPFLMFSTPASTLHNDWIEVLQPPPMLLIVGAGHCGIELAKVADLIGFQIVVQDDRSEWANSTNYPQADQVSTQPLTEFLQPLGRHQQLYVALVTRSYQYDVQALTLLLKREIPCQYIGMIGSKKRVQQVYQAIAQSGISPDLLQSIHAPIGLDIGALTPAEIAVSIGAELILQRRGGTGRPLSDLLH